MTGKNLSVSEMKALSEEKQKEIYDKVKSARKKGKTCLPVDSTEVLTSKGWKKYGELGVGDLVMSLNVETGETEFGPIKGFVFHEDQEITKISVGGWEVESTPNHRWYTERTTGRDVTRRMMKGYQTTENLKTHYSIITSAPYVGGNSAVTADEAALMGWVLSDGYLDSREFVGAPSQGKHGHKVSVRMGVAQSSKKFLSEVEDLVNRLGISHNRYVNNSGVDVFDFHSGWSRDFLTSIGLEQSCKHEIDCTRWLLGLSREALEAFFEAFWRGDGNTAKSGMEYNTKIVYQNRGNIADAVQLAGELLGKHTTKSGGDYCTVRMTSRNKVTMQKAKFVTTRISDVFCLVTEFGNFVIRQGDAITITGNCNYASVYNAGAAAIARAAGVSLEEGKILHTAYWELQWAVKAIADEQVVIEHNGGKWLVNPINGFCYSLRKDSDRFSTLCQGTGSFFFDMWVDAILEGQMKKWGKKSLTGSFHDEKIIVHKDTPAIREAMEEIIKDAIWKVNARYKLRRKLGCETQFGYRYSHIH